jgi:hypothetical protein
MSDREVAARGLSLPERGRAQLIAIDVRRTATDAASVRRKRRPCRHDAPRSVARRRCEMVPRAWGEQRSEQRCSPRRARAPRALRSSCCCWSRPVPGRRGLASSPPPRMRAARIRGTATPALQSTSTGSRYGESRGMPCSKAAPQIQPRAKTGRFLRGGISGFRRRASVASVATRRGRWRGSGARTCRHAPWPPLR